MRCSHCNKKEANTHIRRIINGHEEEMYLCDECARELGVMNDFDFEPFSFDGFFGNLLGAGSEAFNALVGVADSRGRGHLRKYVRHPRVRPCLPGGAEAHADAGPPAVLPARAR